MFHFQPVQGNMHSQGRKHFAFFRQPLSCLHCLLPAICRSHFKVGSQHEQDRMKEVSIEPPMRGGGKNASGSATENRLLEGLRELLNTVDEKPSQKQTDIGGEAKLLEDLSNLIHQHKKGCLLQQLKSLVTQATRCQNEQSEPSRKNSVDTGKRQTFYGSWKNAKGQNGGGKHAKPATPDGKSWAQVVAGAQNQWNGSDGWTEFVWKPRQEDWQVEDKSAVQVVTSLDRLEHKLEENNKTPLVAVTTDVEELSCLN